MENIVIFCLFIGIGSTVILDLWVTLVEKVLAIAPTNWGSVGRWITGIPQGKWTLDSADTRPITKMEKVLGWGFHYVIGIAYAALLILLFGTGFMRTPTILPVVIVGLVLSTLAGLAILMPALGAGFMGKRVPNWSAMFIYLIVAHGIFASGQYCLAIWYAA